MVPAPGAGGGADRDDGSGGGVVLHCKGKIYDPGRRSRVDLGPGTAVSDLQTLEKNHDMYSDFEMLDDLDVQQDVVANQ